MKPRWIIAGAAALALALLTLPMLRTGRTGEALSTGGGAAPAKAGSSCDATGRASFDFVLKDQNNLPVKLAELSRFRSGKEAKTALEGLANGTVDLVIGLLARMQAERNRSAAAQACACCHCQRRVRKHCVAHTAGGNAEGAARSNRAARQSSSAAYAGYSSGCRIGTFPGATDELENLVSAAAGQTQTRTASQRH